MDGELRSRRGPGAWRRPGRVRLTRRGRAVVLGLGLLLGALVVVGLLVTAIATPASQAADPAATGVTGGPPGGPPGESRVAVVRPGDTLWSVAARHVPSHDAYGMIEEIRRLNDLPDHTIHPGQELIVPERR